MAYPYVAWISVLIVIPMFMIVFYAFTEAGNDVMNFKFTLANFARFLSDKIFLEVMFKSLYVAAVTTILSIIIGYPTAYIIAKSSDTTKKMLVLLITLPMWINMLVRTYAWMGILQDKGLINTILGFFGFETVKLLHTDFAVILGMVYNFVPFMILQIYTSLNKMDSSILQAAEDLGANKFNVFMKVTLPLSLPGVISGITLVFLPAVSSFFIPKLLGGGQFVLIGNVIESQFVTSGNWSFGSAISLVMAVIVMISMWITKKIDSANANKGEKI